MLLIFNDSRNHILGFVEACLWVKSINMYKIKTQRIKGMDFFAINRVKFSTVIWS